MIVRVRDYGKGLPAHLSGKPTTEGMGVGVSGMQERLRQFGGLLSLSRAEPGTLVEAKIPLYEDTFRRRSPTCFAAALSAELIASSARSGRIFCRDVVL